MRASSSLITVLSLAALFSALVSCGGDLPPSAPTGLKAQTISDTWIDLVWNEATDDAGVSGYKVYRDGTYINSTVANSVSNTGLTNSTYYCYTVSAFDGEDNESGQSEEACAWTLRVPDTQAPTVPQDLIANAVTYSRIDLSWSPSTDNESGVAGYMLYREGGFINSIITNSASDTELSVNTEYCYSITAFDFAGGLDFTDDSNESSHSDTVCETTLAE